MMKKRHKMLKKTPRYRRMFKYGVVVNTQNESSFAIEKGVYP